MAVHASGSALHAFPGVGASHFGVSGTGLSSRWGIQTRPRSAQLLHAVFVGVIRFSLDVALYDNAQFFGERMVAHFPGDDEALFLLALSHARRARHPTVLALLRSTSYPQSKYLLAQSCRAVGRLQEAEMHMQDVAAVASDFSGPNAGLVRCKHSSRPRTQGKPYRKLIMKFYSSDSGANFPGRPRKVRDYVPASFHLHVGPSSLALPGLEAGDSASFGR